MNKTYCRLVVCLIVALSITSIANAQKNVGIGTLSPDASAILQLETSEKGFLAPRMTATQMTAIAAPQQGLLVYNTTDSCFWFYKKTQWRSLCQQSSGITDSLILTHAYIDSLISSYIYTDTIVAGYGKFDTLIVNGQPIETLVNGIIDTTAWKLKGNAGTSPAVHFIGTTDAQDWVVRTSNTERMRVLSTGNIGIGTNNPSYTLHVVGRLKTDGINETSDLRLKHNITTIPNALSKVQALRGVYFDWRNEEFPNHNFEKTKQVGVIAQETELVLPELVKTDNEGYKSVEYSKLTALLIEAVKELKIENDALKLSVAELQKTNEKMSKKSEEQAKNIETYTSLLQQIIASNPNLIHSVTADKKK